jgi:putative transposase
LSTKIHAAGDALGNPVRLIGSPGQRNDIAFAHELVDGFEADATIADKGYDADHLCDKLAQAETDVVIPPKRNRKIQRAYDVQLYKERNLIERFFNKLKHFRRVATRYAQYTTQALGQLFVHAHKASSHEAWSEVLKASSPTRNQDFSRRPWAFRAMVRRPMVRVAHR